MAPNSSKDQLPAYTSQNNQASTTGDSAEPSTSAVLKPNHSTRASKLWHATSQGEYPTSTLEYLELTFSVMVVCHCKSYSTYKPVVLAIDEDYGTLLKNLLNMFDDASMTRGVEARRMSVVWEKSHEERSLLFPIADSEVTEDSITAMLRLLKSKNGIDQIHLS